MAVLARVDEGRARAAAGGADDHVGVAVAVQVAGGGHMDAEGPGALRRLEGPQEPAVPACVEAGPPAAPRRAGGAGDHVGDAVAVRVPGGLQARAQGVPGLAIRGPDPAARPPGIDVDPARGGPAQGLGGRGDHRVVGAVAVYVAEVPGDPPELVAAGLADDRVEDRRGLDEGPREVPGHRQQGREARIAPQRGEVVIHRGLAQIHLPGGLGAGEPGDGLVRLP